MTIAKRLVLLLAVPALIGLGAFTRWQLTTIETRSRFVAELQVPSLATLGNMLANTCRAAGAAEEHVERRDQ